MTGVMVNCSSTACTNLIVTKGASKDGSVMITYAADSHVRYGALAFYPAADHPSGAMLDGVHYENGKVTGQIPEVSHTYSVIGFMNEHQVAIGETTWGGLKELGSQPEVFLDYGSLMKIALQRGKTAREAIRVIFGVPVSVMQGYGPSSAGSTALSGIMRHIRNMPAGRWSIRIISSTEASIPTVLLPTGCRYG